MAESTLNPTSAGTLEEFSMDGNDLSTEDQSLALAIAEKSQIRAEGGGRELAIPGSMIVQIVEVFGDQSDERAKTAAEIAVSLKAGGELSGQTALDEYDRDLIGDATDVLDKHGVSLSAFMAALEPQGKVADDEPGVSMSMLHDMAANPESYSRVIEAAAELTEVAEEEADDYAGEFDDEDDDEEIETVTDDTGEEFEL